MIMKLNIPTEKLTKSYDALVELAHPFDIQVTNENDIVSLEGEEPELLDFLTLYHDIDMNAAQQDINAYATKQYKKTYSPEFALQRINEFVMSKGGFDDYDAVFEALNNAIHGVD